MKKMIIKLLLGVLMSLGGWYVLNKGDEYISGGALREAAYLCKHGVSVQGYVDSTFTETNMKVMKINTRMYSFNYTYWVGDSSYKGIYTSNSPKFKDSITVWFDRKDPSKSMASSPCVTFESYKSKKHSDYKSWFYYIGFPLILIGIGVLYSCIKDLFGMLMGLRKKTF